MARIKNGLHDSFTGKLGNVVGYKWKGRDCVRAWTMPKDKKSPAQLECRRIFGTMSSLGSSMLPIVKIGFRGIASMESTTEKNVFVRLNSKCANVVGGEVKIDYANLVVADGTLEPVGFGEPTTDDGRVFHVTFSGKSNTDRFNYVVLAAYIPEKRGCFLAQPVYQRAGRVEITLPESWAGLEAHLYGFCWDGDDKASPSSYVGVLNKTE